MNFLTRNIFVTLTLLVSADSTVFADTTDQKITVNCEEILAKKIVFLKSPIAWVQENWPALMSRVHPTVKEKNYDIRVFSNGPNLDQFSPSEISKRMTREINSIFNLFESLGFKVDEHIHFVSEAHYRASEVYLVGLDSSSEPQKHIHTPVAAISPLLQVKHKVLFFLNEHLSDSFTGVKNGDVIIFIPVAAEGFHYIEATGSLAHEIAHRTQNRKGINSQIWNEARADILAFLSTGEVEIRAPAPVVSRMMNAKGEWIYLEDQIIRSLEIPLINHISKVPPGLDPHTIGGLIAGLLYDIIYVYGQDIVVNFIQWMDELNLEEHLLVEASIGEQHLAEEEFKINPRNRSILLNPKYPERIRSFNVSQVKEVARLLRKWMEDSGQGENFKVVINQMLADRGL